MSKKILIICLFCFTKLSYQAFAEDYVEVKKNQSGLYAMELRKMNEAPMEKLNKGSMLQILVNKGDKYKVKTTGGKIGWIEKRLVGPPPKGTKFIMGEQEIIGNLDDPQAIYILETQDPNFKPIKLNRSFGDEMNENVDKETMEKKYNK